MFTTDTTIGEQRALSPDIWPFPTIIMPCYRALLCADNSSFYIDMQCFTLDLTLVCPISR